MTSAPNDSVYLVLWFKEGLTTPIYSYDVRELLSGEPKHWWDADLLGSRAFFNAHSSPAHLLLRHVTPEDAGLYKCRVDFQREPTRNSRVNLTIIIPPKEVLIFDSNEQTISDVIGPISEGKELRLTCEASGGNPPPKLHWLMNDEVIDESSEYSGLDLVRNELFLDKLERDTIGSEISCEARYHPTYPPIAKSATLDLNLAPQEVHIEAPDVPLSSGREYEFVCTSEGSKPPATLSWWSGSKRFPAILEETLNNDSISRSVVRLEANASLNGQSLLCKAENVLIPMSVIHQDIVLDIFYSPKVVVDFGAAPNPAEVLTGDSVFLNCDTDANPSPYKVVWMRNDMLLSHDSSHSALLSNWSLLLQNIQPEDEGNYTCIASNVEGDGISNPFVIKVKHSPFCFYDKPKVFGATIGEPVLITCQVKAYPKAASFEWWFDNTEEFAEFPLRDPSARGRRRGKEEASNATTRGSAKEGKTKKKQKGQGRQLSFTPRNEEDFGTLLCYSRNEIGKQEAPCIFKIVPASLPTSPYNCSVRDLTVSDLLVMCVRSTNHDVDTNHTYVLDVLGEESRKVIFSLTSNIPRFRVRGLDADTTFYLLIYAKNSDGLSDSVKLKVRTPKPPVKQLETRLGTEGRTDNTSHSSSIFPLETASILGALIGGILIIVVILFAALYSLKRKNRQQRNAARPQDSGQCPATVQPSKLQTLEQNYEVVLQDESGSGTNEHELSPPISNSDYDKSTLLPRPTVETIMEYQKSTGSSGHRREVIPQRTLRTGASKGSSDLFRTKSIESSQKDVRRRGSSPYLEETFSHPVTAEAQYIKPLGFSPGKENAALALRDIVSGSQTLPIKSQRGRLRKKRNSISDDLETRPPDLISCSSSPPSPAPNDFSSDLSYRSESLLLEELNETIQLNKKGDLDLSSKRESRV